MGNEIACRLLKLRLTVYNGRMTRAKQRLIVNEIRRLQKEVAELRARRREILTGAASASLSSGSGSKSYSNWTPAQLDAAIASDVDQISAYKRALAEVSSLGIGQLKIVRC